jgi:hypothetical protein
MTMTRFLRLIGDRSGGVLVETTLLFPMMLVLSFGLVEFGMAWNQWNTAEKATQVGARWAATRGPVIVGLEDCGVATSATAGTDCVDVPGSDSWTVTCNAGSPGGACDAAALTALTAEMQAVFPRIEAANVEVEFSG